MDDESSSLIKEPEVANVEMDVSLKAFFNERAEKGRIQLAYLFGSQAGGTAGPISDYDFAVLYAELPQPGFTYKLAHQLTVFLAVERVDLVTLNRAPVELRYAVIVDGLVVFEASSAIRVEFEAATLSRYGDYLPVLRRQKSEILEERENEARIQRYRAAFGKTRRLLDQIRAV